MRAAAAATAGSRSKGRSIGSAAARFRKFLSQVRDRNLPIYFSSPGGNLDQALAMGAMLRERPRRSPGWRAPW